MKKTKVFDYIKINRIPVFIRTITVYYVIKTKNYLEKVETFIIRNKN